MSLPQKQKKSLKSQKQPSKDGKNKEKLKLSGQKENLPIEDTTFLTFLKNLQEEEKKQYVNEKEKTDTSVIVESLREINREILNVKNNTLANDTQLIKSLRISDQVSTLRGKVLKPFWTSQSTEISKNLWLPIKTVCADSDLKSLNTSSQNFLTQQSWFSTKRQQHLQKNLQKTYCPSRQCSLPDFMECEKENIQLKTLKIRLILTSEEKKNLKHYFGQYRWYYNCAKNIYELNEYKYKKKITKSSFRDELRTYKYIDKNTYEKVNGNEFPKAPWMEDIHIHNRIPRGAIHNFIANVNAAISNKKAGNIKDFNLKFREKKDRFQVLTFEDSQIPKDIKKYKGIYKIGNKGKISFQDLQNKDGCKMRGITIRHDTQLNRYYALYPIDEKILFNKRDNKMNVNKSSFISLDTGVRTFQTGYAEDHIVEIGNGDWRKIYKYLLEQDKIRKQMELRGKTKRRNKRFLLLSHRIRSMISELHWKSASFLTSNYEKILLPDFRISGMVKGNIPKSVKRMLYQFSYYLFRQKMEYKAQQNGSKLFIVDESYTSKTCGRCGHIRSSFTGKHFVCPQCNLHLDRDVNGARNIYIKNYDLIHH